MGACEWKEEESSQNIDLRGDATLNECLMSHVLWLSAHISAASFILLQISSLCSPSLLYSSTNTSGLTLFCTWLTARCLKYFPVCSRINCSSGNDDSSKKQKNKKKEKNRRKEQKQNLVGKREKLSTETCFVFDVFSSYFYIFVPGSVV